RKSRLPRTTLHSTSCVSSTRRTSRRSSTRSRRRSTSRASASGAAPAAANAGRLVGKRALVELGEDRVVRTGEQIRRNLVSSLRDARVVELAADERQERRLDLGIAQFRA